MFRIETRWLLLRPSVMGLPFCQVNWSGLPGESDRVTKSRASVYFERFLPSRRNTDTGQESRRSPVLRNTDAIFSSTPLVCFVISPSRVSQRACPAISAFGILNLKIISGWTHLASTLVAWQLGISSVWIFTRVISLEATESVVDCPLELSHLDNQMGQSFVWWSALTFSTVKTGQQRRLSDTLRSSQGSSGCPCCVPCAHWCWSRMECVCQTAWHAEPGYLWFSQCSCSVCQLWRYCVWSRWRQEYCQSFGEKQQGTSSVHPVT